MSVPDLRPRHALGLARAGTPVRAPMQIHRVTDALAPALSLIPRVARAAL